MTINPSARPAFNKFHKNAKRSNLQRSPNVHMEIGSLYHAIIEHLRWHAHEVLEGVWIFRSQLYHKLVILPPPLNPGSRPELLLTLSSSPSPTSMDVLGNV